MSKELQLLRKPSYFRLTDILQIPLEQNQGVVECIVSSCAGSLTDKLQFSKNQLKGYRVLPVIKPV